MITVFTPTFNRASKVNRVWSSLNSQTIKNFEWIVVDDGSDDEIESVIEGYKSNSEFQIIFHKFEKNRGKHVAINKGLELASGKYFLIADSDDAFEANTIETFTRIWGDIEKDQYDDFCAVRVCCKDQNGRRVSSKMETYSFDASMQEAIYKYKFWKESWSMDRTDLMRRNLFPEDHTGYYPEGIIWKRISRKHKIRFVDESLRIYYIESSGIMKNSKLPIDKISRTIVVGKDVLKNDIKYFLFRPRYFVFISIVFAFYSLLDKTYLQNLKALPFFSQALSVFVLPATLLYYFKVRLCN